MGKNAIHEHMQVLGSDGARIGIVDHLEGPDMIKLAPKDPVAGGAEYVIPLAWVDHVDSQVHLKKPGREVMAELHLGA